jgi:hypothetical protein
MPRMSIECSSQVKIIPDTQQFIDDCFQHFYIVLTIECVYWKEEWKKIIIKGTVQRKLRGVQNGINRKVLLLTCGAGHLFQFFSVSII